jgi:acyl-CoA synthetase (AMP-forming)/AMP-acid ligase II
MSELTRWLENPLTTGIHFYKSRTEGFERWSYESLADRTRKVANALLELGVTRNDRIGIADSYSPDFVCAFFGAILAGATPAPMPTPLTFRDHDSYRTHIRGIVDATDPALVISAGSLIDEIYAMCDGKTRVLSLPDVLDHAASTDSPLGPCADNALIQFTSGSTGRVRGVRVPHASIAANIAAIREWLSWSDSDTGVTWLPVYHDLGLIGCLITPVLSGTDVYAFQPEHFIENPLFYLECMSRARITAIPSFGLSYILRRVRPAKLEGLDFSDVRTIIVAAELVDPTVLRSFEEFLYPHGLRPGVLVTAYGLAEATLCVTGLRPGERWRAVTVDRKTIISDQRIGLTEDPEAGHTIVGCGTPLEGFQVEIVSSDESLLPPGHVGEIRVTGDSVTDGYVVDQASSATRFTANGLMTGDIGFELEGQLYVLGRLGDSIKIRARTLFSEDVEAALGELGFNRGRFVVLLGAIDGEPTAVVAIEEGHLDGRVTQLRQRLNSVCEGTTRQVIVEMPEGGVLRTSSGKPRRRAIWQRFVSGELGKEISTGAE